MEYIGTGFVLTIAGMRLRVRIALEDTPEPAHDAPAGGCRVDELTARDAKARAWNPTTRASPTSGQTGNGISTN